MKVLLVAFGNPDNVLSLSRHLSEKVDLSVLFLVSGEHFRQGVMDADLSDIETGLTTDAAQINKSAGNEISEYINGRFNLWFLKTISRKFIHKRGGAANYRVIRDAITELQKYKFDVIHFNGTSGFLLYFLNKMKCEKRFWTLHDYKSHSGEENTFGNILNRIYTKYNIRYIQHYEYLKEEFIKYFKVSREKVFTVYSGVFDIYRAFEPKKMDLPDKYILFFGRISRYKGLNLLIKSFNSVKKEINDLNLVIAGAGNPELEPYDMDRIKIINRYINPNELVNLIAGSICVVTPYSDSTHSGVIMTSYGFNKPVISSRVSGISEVIIDNETGFLFEPGSAEGLSEKIRTICYNPEIAKKMSMNIGKLQEEGKLNWDLISDKMLKIYSS
ncbi:MAG: glycosyltransferase family 4 protein [Ignavibacteria bacterium]|nr:glycosyltransferase family 4 protein [Ignavibacteria bacterium]